MPSTSRLSGSPAFKLRETIDGETGEPEGRACTAAADSSTARVVNEIFILMFVFCVRLGDRFR